MQNISGADPGFPRGERQAQRNRVPTQTGKPGKMGRHFPVREKSGNFEQTGKVREKSGKITQNTGKTSGNFRKMLCYLLVIFKNELCIIC